MKKCSKCWEEKPYSEFYERAFTPDGYQYHCKACMREKRKQHYKNAKTEFEKDVIRVKFKRKLSPMDVQKKLRQIEILIQEIMATLED